MGEFQPVLLLKMLAALALAALSIWLIVKALS
jgi:hypothetical protein